MGRQNIRKGPGRGGISCLPFFVCIWAAPSRFVTEQSADGLPHWQRWTKPTGHDRATSIVEKALKYGKETKKKTAVEENPRINTSVTAGAKTSIRRAPEGRLEGGQQGGSKPRSQEKVRPGPAAIHQARKERCTVAVQPKTGENLVYECILTNCAIPRSLGVLPSCEAAPRLAGCPHHTPFPSVIAARALTPANEYEPASTTDAAQGIKVGPKSEQRHSAVVVR